MDLLALVMSSSLKSIQPLSVALAVQYMVCLFVCLSQVGVLSKRLSVGHAKNAGQEPMRSVFLRHPTQPVEILGSVSTAFGTMAIQ